MIGDNIKPEQEPKPWTNDEMKKLISELRHWREIRSYYISKVLEAEQEIKTRFGLINDLKSIGAQGGLTPEKTIEIPVDPIKPYE